MRSAPNRLNVIAKPVRSRAGADSDGTAQDHPGDGSAAKNKRDRDKTLDHELIIRQVIRSVKYFAM